jgi:hypothetical protein
MSGLEANRRVGARERALMPEMSNFSPAHIYTPNGILTHGLLALSAITTQRFPSFW